MRGYRVGVFFCAGLVGTVSLINSILTIWAWKSFGVDAGLGIIQHGSCKQTKKLSLWLHLAINILGTAMLSASNYTMQCLSSPTRQDIDKAHAQNIWLDIGVPSLRNLRRVSPRRIVLWWLLALTSLPLHLLYNSAVFDTLSTHQYDVYLVSKDFASGAPFKISAGAPYNTSIEGLFNISTGAPVNFTVHPSKAVFHVADDPSTAYVTRQLSSFRNANSDFRLKNLTARNCILTYGNLFGNSKYRDVLAVSSITNATDSLLKFQVNAREGLNSRSMDWFCREHENRYGYCNVGEAANAEDFTVFETPIDYCTVQETDEKCILQFSLPVMLIIIVCNLIKTVCMILVLLEGGSRPLLTLGDAIASFLNKPDPATKNICLADKYFFRKKIWQESVLTWKPKRHRWLRAASITRWLVCNVL